MDEYFLNWGRQIDMQPSMTYISFAVLPMIFYLLVKVSFHSIFFGARRAETYSRTHTCRRHTNTALMT